MTIISGINGSGKSTYLKQIAMIVILAQCGSYVPAEQACIPVRDQLFCRIGNSDDPEHNLSTFMLEMKETAFICNHATDRSLVLIDELGRATSNEDGVAIAWATCEYLVKKRALTFFVTHYPQLTKLADMYPYCVQNIHLAATVARNTQNVDGVGEIYYTHKVQNGACQVSTDYGVELAAYCGWPAAVVHDAGLVRTTVEEHLGDGQVCDTAGDHRARLENRAVDALREIHQNLMHLVSGEENLTFPAVRDRLVSLHEQIFKSAENEGQREALVNMMQRLLLRDSRGTDQGVQPVSNSLNRSEQGNSNRREQSNAQHYEDDDRTMTVGAETTSSLSTSSSDSSDSCSSSSDDDSTSSDSANKSK